jgi:hypothetical protein
VVLMQVLVLVASCAVLFVRFDAEGMTVFVRTGQRVHCLSSVYHTAHTPRCVLAAAGAGVTFCPVLGQSGASSR